MYSTRRVSGITFIRDVHIQQIGKPNNLKVFESNKTKRFQTGYQQSSNVTYSSNDQCFDTRHSRHSLLDMLTIDIYSS
jgi:hypothetical protein